MRPAGLLLEQGGLVLVGEQQVGAVDQAADHLAVGPRQLLGRVGHERVAALPALLGVPDHRGRVVRADDHQVQGPDPGGHRGELDHRGLRHRAGVERGDLVAGHVGGAGEPGGVLDVGPAHALGVHAVPLQPRVVVVEVAAHRADQHRGQAQQAHAVGHVRPGPAAVLHQVVDEEGQRDVLHLALDELLAERTREGHQVVGGDRTGHGDGHGGAPEVCECRTRCVRRGGHPGFTRA